MIEVIIKDNNGRELSNGDTVRFLNIDRDMQKEDDFFSHQIGTIISIEESVFDAQSEMDNLGYISSPNMISYDRDSLCDMFGLSINIDDSEFKECVIDCINDELKLNLNLEEILNLVNGFEITNPATREGKLITI